MFRFMIRDMLFLTAVIGLCLVWRQENHARQRSLEVLRRSEAVADEGVLEGRWEVMQITSSGKTEDFDGKKAGQMLFSDDWWMEFGPDDRSDGGGECKIVRPGELNVDTKSAPGVTVTTKWRYKLQGGRLWMIRSKTPGDRPSDFDAANDPGLTLYLLKKLELEAPVVQPQAAVTGTDI